MESDESNVRICSVILRISGCQEMVMGYYGRHCKVIGSLLLLKKTDGQVARWIKGLQKSDFHLEHRAGKSHENADAPSRRPYAGDCTHCNRPEENYAIARRTTVVDDRWKPGELQRD